MMTTADKVSLAGLKRAIETSDAKTLAGYYAEDAVIRIIDQNNPPGRPRELVGRSAIAAYYADVCGRAMTHRVEAGIEDETRLAFTQSCAYAAGGRVYCSAMIELADGHIARQTIVQAWDA
jgi:ketosteroid isomerase-like protein